MKQFFQWTGWLIILYAISKLNKPTFPSSTTHILCLSCAYFSLSRYAHHENISDMVRFFPMYSEKRH
jgi:hypothetical protein